MTELKPISGLFAIEVPSMAFGIMINNYGDESELMYTLSMEDISDSEDDTEETLITKKLTPPGSYEILFTTKEATGQQAATIVESKWHKEIDKLYESLYFKNYTPKNLRYWFSNSIESLQSLLRANGLSTDKNYLLIKQLS